MVNYGFPKLKESKTIVGAYKYSKIIRRIIMYDEIYPNPIHLEKLTDIING